MTNREREREGAPLDGQKKNWVGVYIGRDPPNSTRLCRQMQKIEIDNAEHLFLFSLLPFIFH